MKPTCKFCGSSNVKLTPDKVSKKITWIHCKKCNNFTIDRELIVEEKKIDPVASSFVEGDKVKLTGIDQEVLHSPCVCHPVNGSIGKVSYHTPPAGKVAITFPKKTKWIGGSKYADSVTIFFKSDLVEKV